MILISYILVLVLTLITISTQTDKSIKKCCGFAHCNDEVKEKILENDIEGVKEETDNFRKDGEHLKQEKVSNARVKRERNLHSSSKPKQMVTPEATFSVSLSDKLAGLVNSNWTWDQNGYNNSKGETIKNHGHANASIDLKLGPASVVGKFSGYIDTSGKNIGYRGKTDDGNSSYHLVLKNHSLGSGNTKFDVNYFGERIGGLVTSARFNNSNRINAEGNLTKNGSFSGSLSNNSLHDYFTKGNGSLNWGDYSVNGSFFGKDKMSKIYAESRAFWKALNGWKLDEEEEKNGSYKKHYGGSLAQHYGGKSFLTAKRLKYNLYKIEFMKWLTDLKFDKSSFKSGSFRRHLKKNFDQNFLNYFYSGEKFNNKYFYKVLYRTKFRKRFGR